MVCRLWCLKPLLVARAKHPKQARWCWQATALFPRCPQGNSHSTRNSARSSTPKAYSSAHKSCKSHPNKYHTHQSRAHNSSRLHHTAAKSHCSRCSRKSWRSTNLLSKMSMKGQCNLHSLLGKLGSSCLICSCHSGSWLYTDPGRRNSSHLCNLCSLCNFENCR